MNVVPIREANAYAPDNESLAEALKQAAGWLKDEYGEVHSVVMLIEHGDGQIARLTFGKSMDRARVVGLLSFGLHQAMHE